MSHLLWQYKHIEYCMEPLRGCSAYTTRRGRALFNTRVLNPSSCFALGFRMNRLWSYWSKIRSRSWPSLSRNLICHLFFFSFHQAWEVESGSHSVQQQPVLQGQPLPLQVEHTTRQHDWWQCKKKKNQQLEVKRAVPRGCGLLACCAVASVCCYLEDSFDISQDRGHRGENGLDHMMHYHHGWAANLEYGQEVTLCYLTCVNKT